MAKMTPRKYAKIPLVRESVGSWCEAIANELREADEQKAVNSVKSQTGDVISVVPSGSLAFVPATAKDAKPDASLVTERRKHNGVVEKEYVSGFWKPAKTGELAYLSRSDGCVSVAIPVVSSRPYARRAEIIAFVQSQIERKQGVRMGKDWIEKCWDDFRRLAESISAGDS